MAGNFERHRSTRWVKADVPSYGDEWGNEYDEYEQEEDIGDTDDAENEHGVYKYESSDTPQNPYIHPDEHPGVPVKKPEHLVSNSTLVLSIDKSNFADANDTTEEDDSSDDEGVEEYESSVVPHSKISEPVSNFTSSSSQKTGEGRQNEAAKGTANVAATNANPASKNVPDPADFMPPTPTYQTQHQFAPRSPETDASDRSYLSDADSIQREPDILNVRNARDHFPETSSFTARPSEKSFLETVPPPSRVSEESSVSMSTGDRSFVEPQNPKGGNNEPEALVLSIDRMNLDTSDDSSFDFDSESHERGRSELSERSEHSPGARNSQLSRASDDDDDWGYNSEHSSNFDEQDAQLNLPELQLRKTDSSQIPRHRVKTDALDSLIDDLSRMEGDTSLFEGDSANTLQAGQPTDSGNSDYHTTRGSKGFLPTLDSIHDMNMPDFANASFNSDVGSARDHVPRLRAPSILDEDHEKFVSSVRQDSIRKPPPVPLTDPPRQPASQEAVSKNTDSDISPEVSHDTEGEKEASSHGATGGGGTGEANIEGASVEETRVEEEALEKNRAPEIAPPPITKDASQVDRRASTMSTSTFNFGAWKPNTSKYRDQFVNDNDNESQMNVSLYNKDDSAYKKFTRMGPGSTYAPSISNSSCISVPDTVDTNLQQINEDQSDEEYPETMSVAPSYHPTTVGSLDPSAVVGSSDPSLGSSVLHDHVYEKAKFHEESHSPAASADDLAPIREEGEPRVVSTGSTGTGKTAATPDSDTPSAHKRAKYPVSNWKNIMAASQPVDRIALLKKARADEINYETGLSQWLRESLKSTESPHIQIGQLATQAYKNAQHTDVRRHTSIRSKVNLVKDRMETGNLGMQASSLGRKFLNRGKKLIKQSSD